jgi:hypothetical protein
VPQAPGADLFAALTESPNYPAFWAAVRDRAVFLKELGELAGPYERRCAVELLQHHFPTRFSKGTPKALVNFIVEEVFAQAAADSKLLGRPNFNTIRIHESGPEVACGAPVRAGGTEVLPLITTGDGHCGLHVFGEFVDRGGYVGCHFNAPVEGRRALVKPVTDFLQENSDAFAEHRGIARTFREFAVSAGYVQAYREHLSSARQSALSEDGASREHRRLARLRDEDLVEERAFTTWCVGERIGNPSFFMEEIDLALVAYVRGKTLVVYDDDQAEPATYNAGASSPLAVHHAGTRGLHWERCLVLESSE